MPLLDAAGFRKEFFVTLKGSDCGGDALALAGSGYCEGRKVEKTLTVIIWIRSEKLPIHLCIPRRILCPHLP